MVASRTRELAGVRL